MHFFLVLFSCENGFAKAKGDTALASRIEVGLLKDSVGGGGERERHFEVKSLMNFGDPKREGIVLFEKL